VEGNSDGLTLARQAQALLRNAENAPEAQAKAERLSRQAIEMFPEEPEVWKIFAEVFQNRGDLNGALSVLNGAAPCMAEHPAWWMIKAHLLQRNQQAEEALAALSKAIQWAGSNPTGLLASAPRRW